jgi:hypothetical protein
MGMIPSRIQGDAERLNALNSYILNCFSRYKLLQDLSTNVD